jgi:hypothetical protein
VGFELLMVSNSRLLRFSPGATPGKKRKQIENDDEKQKKKQEYEKNCPDRIFLKMANRATFVSF